MKQRRKIAFEEHLDIVTYTLSHDNNYQAAIEKFQVSYQQVYSQARKYAQYGLQCLTERRGKRLSDEIKRTSEEKLQLKK